MAEKKPSESDYYMDPFQGDYPRVVEHYRHGRQRGSNYLYLDGHAECFVPPPDQQNMDAWDPLNIR